MDDEYVVIPVEYKVLLIQDLLRSKDMEGDLNDLGSEGWELVVWGLSCAIFMRR